MITPSPAPVKTPETVITVIPPVLGAPHRWIGITRPTTKKEV